MRIRLLLLALAIAYGIPAQTGVNSLTGSPVASANVVLDHTGGGRVWGRTDAGGVFTGRIQSAGKHLLTVTRKVYRMTGAAEMGRMIEIQPGAETGATIEMLQLGVLSGRVLDQYGDPVRHAIVRALDKMSAPGEDQYYESSSAGITDDRGEYRIIEVEPGSHYVAAEYSNRGEEQVSATRAGFDWPETGVLFSSQVRPTSDRRSNRKAMQAGLRA